MYLLKDLIQYLEELAPPFLAESWDNIGLLVGHKSQELTGVLCALDINEHVLDEAIDLGANCIVTHHPFIFSPLKKIDLSSSKGGLIEKLIKHNISVYTMHTNLDVAIGGINDLICDKLDLRNKKVLHVTYTEPMAKLCIYVPESHLEAVRETLIEINQYELGNYTGCTFNYIGEGTFIPLEGSQPYIGEKNTLEKVSERKLECIINPKDLHKIMSEVEKIHPYEEIAYDLISLRNVSKAYGIGRYGQIQKTTLSELAEHIKKIFNIPYVRIVGDPKTHIEKIALCSGSGSSYINNAASVADVYITGDLKFHEAQSALENGLCLIDVGHYPSENIMMPYLKKEIEKNFSQLLVQSSLVDGEVFKTL